MSSKERSSSRFAVTSRYSVSMIASRSPSSVILTPVVVVMMRMNLYPEALDGGRLVGVDLDEVLRAGQRQHRFDALLDAGQLQVAAGVVNLPVQVQQAANRRAVHIGDWRQVDENLTFTAGDEDADGRREVGKDRIHQTCFADADDRDGARLFGLDVHR